MDFKIIKELLGDRDGFYKMILEQKEISNIWGSIFQMFFVSVVFYAFYGFVMGIDHSISQAVSSMVKLPVLFYLSLFICYPAMFTYNAFLGSKMTLSQSIAMIISALTLTSAILASFTPISLFFIVIESSYEFLVLLHVTLMAIAGLAGMAALISGLKSACEKYSVYPKFGIKIFRFWVVIFGFVGTQLAYNLKPFVGSPDLAFQLLRHSKGNFYILIINQIQNLF